LTFPSQFASNAEASVGLIFMKVYNSWHSEVKAALEPVNLTHPQFVVLTVLGYLNKNEPSQHISQKRIATFSDIDAMTVSQIVALLEKKGLLFRRPHPLDSRARSLSVSETGWNTLTAAIPLVEAVDHKFFGVLGEGQNTLMTLLKTLLEKNR